MASHGTEVAPDRRLFYRVGINLGDVVVVEDVDVLGDGFNVAARLEALAPPGGIVVSRSVRDQVRARLDIRMADLGLVRAKNIARPIRADAYYAGGYWVLGSILLCFSGQQERAVEIYAKPMELNARNPDIMAEYAFVVAQLLGRAEEGIGLVEEAMRLNPRYADWYDVALATATFYAREPERSVALIGAIEYPKTWSEIVMAAAYGHLGDMAEAQDAISRIRAIAPSFSLATFQANDAVCANGSSADALAYLGEGLTKAGLPAE